LKINITAKGENINYISRKIEIKIWTYHPPFFGAATGFSPVGNLLCCRTGCFLPEDSEEKDARSFYFRVGSFGPWLPPLGKTITGGVKAEVLVSLIFTINEA
jgi:hypothetical protein